MADNKTSKVSVHERLQQLPVVFHLNTLACMMGSRASATVALHRWTQRGWAQPAGPRASVYFNLVQSKTAAQDHAHHALLMLYPSRRAGRHAGRPARLAS